MVVVKMSFTTKHRRLFFGTVVADTGNFKLRVDNGIAFLSCVCPYAGNNLRINSQLSNTTAFRTNQELRDTMVVIASNVGTDDVFVGYMKSMSKMFSLKKIQYPINRHRLDLLGKMMIAVINQFIGGKRFIGMK